MRSATDFLPSTIRLFMNLVSAIAKFGVGQNFALFSGVTTRHVLISYFGRFAPYFERR